MRSDVLAADLAAERARAVRLLLRFPLLNATVHQDGFREVVRHSDWLSAWFDDVCGWLLVVDPAAGFARLAKRARGARVDGSRPVRRSRGARQPFDRRRYQLFCLVAAQLVQHPVTTVGLLARAIAADGALDTSRHRERVALVDVLRVLIEWQALTTSGGAVDDFAQSEEANALLQADTTRLHRLLVSTVPPGSLPEGTSASAAIVFLGAEPRYGRDGAPDAPSIGGDEQRLRRVRHMVGRRLLDDPVVHLDDLDDEERAYVDNPSGRNWLRDRITEAGLELEEREEGLVAVDPDGLATDIEFPGPHGNAHQLALLLIDDLLVDDGSGGRRRIVLDGPALERAVDAIFERFPNWARSRRDPQGRHSLAVDAIDLLAGFGLVRRLGGGAVAARPVAARYRAGALVQHRSGALFDDAAPDPPSGDRVAGGRSGAGGPR